MLFLHLKCLLSGLSEDSLSNSRIPVRSGISGTWFNPLPSTCFGASLESSREAHSSTCAWDIVGIQPFDDERIHLSSQIDVRLDGNSALIAQFLQDLDTGLVEVAIRIAVRLPFLPEGNEPSAPAEPSPRSRGK